MEEAYIADIVYKVPGKNHGPKGKTYNWKPVNSKGEFDDALKEGWFNTLDEAVNGKELVRARDDDGQYKADDPETPDDEAWTEAPATREELNAKAKELGIQYSRNISDKKLLKLIEKKLKG